MEQERFTTLANEHGKFRCDTLRDIKIPRQSKKHPGKGRMPMTSTCQGAPAHTCVFSLVGYGRIRIYQARLVGTKYQWVWRQPL